MTSPQMRGAQRRGLTVPRAQTTAADGLLVVDKPQGVTSHDVVAAMRRMCATRKVGHAGTLDPMATGVLLIGVGKATRLLRYLTGTDKSYRATMVLGASRDSDDADGTITAALGATDIEVATLEAAMVKQRGNIMQVPATVSAIKVAGQRAHALHRQGEQVQLAARPVLVTQFELTGPLRNCALEVDGAAVPVQEADVEVTCSAGTYVRALARDVGAELGCGGYLSALRRTRVGAWDENAALTIDQLQAQVEQTGAVTTLPLAQVCAALMPTVELDQAQARRLANGNAHGLEVGQASGPVAACYDGQVVAVLERRSRGWQPAVVLASAIQ